MRIRKTEQQNKLLNHELSTSALWYATFRKETVLLKNFPQDHLLINLNDK